MWKLHFLLKKIKNQTLISLMILWLIENCFLMLAPKISWKGRGVEAVTEAQQCPWVCSGMVSYHTWV